jgi:hypothetical protein
MPSRVWLIPICCCFVYPVFHCRSADPLGLEASPSGGIPLATRNRCWLDIIAAIARFLRRMSNLLPYTLRTPCSVDSSATLGSLLTTLCPFGLPLQPRGCCHHPTLSVAFLKCLVCVVLWTPSVMTRSPFLVCLLHPPGDLLLMLQPPPPPSCPPGTPTRADIHALALNAPQPPPISRFAPFITLLRTTLPTSLSQHPSRPLTTPTPHTPLLPWSLLLPNRAVYVMQQTKCL